MGQLPHKCFLSDWGLREGRFCLEVSWRGGVGNLREEDGQRKAVEKGPYSSRLSAKKFEFTHSLSPRQGLQELSPG